LFDAHLGKSGIFAFSSKNLVKYYFKFFMLNCYLQTLRGILQITNPQKNEFIVAYDSDLQPHMDLELMQCINTHHWQYRQLSHGKTLEEKLFFRDVHPI